MQKTRLNTGKWPDKVLKTVKADTKEIKANTKEIGKDTKQLLIDTGNLQKDTRSLREIAEGGEIPREECQSDTARLKQIRTLKPLLDNEAGDLKESEAKRIHSENMHEFQTFRQLLRMQRAVPTSQSQTFQEGMLQRSGRI